MNRAYPNMVEQGGKMMPQEEDKMPQGPEAAPEGAEGGAGNPVIDALKKIGIFAAAQAEKGNAAIMEAFKALIQAMGNMAGEGEPKREQSADAAPPQPQNVERGSMSKRGAAPVL